MKDKRPFERFLTKLIQLLDDCITRKQRLTIPVLKVNSFVVVVKANVIVILHFIKNITTVLFISSFALTFYIRLE